MDDLFAPGTTDWTPTRAAALARLEAFLPRAGRAYAAERNHDRGPEARDNVSVLSPYIRYRLISEEEVTRAVLARHAPSTAEKFLQEVCWRTYWKGWLELRPAVWGWYREALARDRAAADADPDLSARLADAEAGRAGIDCFDAWANELRETGYLHNHARMWFASLWTFHLGLPWTLGAQFFLRHLADADPASNTLSWRWVAGLQTRGKIYQARPDNIRAYTQGRFAADLPPPRRALAPLSEDRGLPPPLAPVSPAPAPAAKDPGLLLMADDLGGLDDPGFAKALARSGAGEPRSALIVLHHAAGPLAGIGDAAGGFLTGAGADAAERHAARGLSCDVVADPDPAFLAQWASSRGLDQLRVCAPAVGPGASWLAEAAGPLTVAGIGLAPFRRTWDARLWPHATHGFFRFKEKLPALYKDLR